MDRVNSIDDEAIKTITAVCGGHQEPKIAYAPNSREFRSGGWGDVSPTLSARDYKDPKIISTIIDIKSNPNFSAIPNSEVAPTQYAQEHYGVVDQELKIRKLTPLEAWRLMGIDDEDFYKAQAVNSNSQLYKQAGNAIVVDVLYHIFKQLFYDKPKFKVGDVVTLTNNEFRIVSINDFGNGHIEYEGSHDGDDWTLYETDIQLLKGEE
jgi:hypothetical protein